MPISHFCPHSPSRSDVMSLIVALYAIRVRHKLATFHPNSPHIAISFPVKAQMILGTPTAGTGQRSLPLSLTVFSSWHSASLLRWRLWSVSSARLVCTISLCCKSLPLNSHRNIKSQTDSHSRIFRLGIQYRRPIPLPRCGNLTLPRHRPNTIHHRTYPHP